MKARVLIADDEQHACMELEYILKQDARVDIVAICSSGDEALKEICKLKLDMVFLDISMPGIDGISLGKYLKSTMNPPCIIYLTAYDQYAIEAIKVGARDYILKPFSDNDIKETLNSAFISLMKKNEHNQHQRNTSTFTRICGVLNEKLILIDQQDVLNIYALGREVYIRANNIDYLSRHTLTELETKLDPNIFYRCHRNFIVNLYKIKQVDPWFNNTYQLTMNDDQKTLVPISRSKAKSIKGMLDI